MTFSLSHQNVRFINVYTKFLFGFALLAAYLYLFSYFYVNSIYQRWGYFGFRLGTDNETAYLISVASVFLAYLVIPRRATSASDYILWLLFVLGFVPIQITFGLSDSLEGQGYWYQIALLVSFSISSLVARLTARIRWVSTASRMDQLGDKTLERSGSLRKIFLWSSAFIVLLLVFRFRSILSFAGVEDVYEQRAAASEFGIGAFFGYLILWTTYLLSPLIIAMGLVERKKRLVIMAVGMLIAIYMITASKIIFIIIAFSFSIHVFNRINLQRHMYLLFAVPIVPMVIALFFFNFLGGSEVSDLATFVIDQIVIRGIAIQGMIFNLYVEFFSVNQLTYYSHVTGVSLFVDYPYDLPIGRIISIYAYGHPNSNANSGIWATDGVAAGGPLGVIFIGVLLGAFLGFVNRITKNVGHEFLSIAMVPLAMLMVNVSMFTTLSSGGGFLLVLLVRWLWKDIAAKETRPKRWI